MLASRAMLNLDYDNPVSAHVDPDERLLWMGRPPQGWVIRRGEWLTVAMVSVTIGLFFWFIGGPRWMRSNPMAPALPVGIVLFLTVGRYALERGYRRRTWYALTDRRVLILQVGGFRASVHAFALAALPWVNLDEQPVGAVSTITFGSFFPVDPFRRQDVLIPGRPVVPCFELDRSAREVYETFAAARDAAVALPPGRSGGGDS